MTLVTQAVVFAAQQHDGAVRKGSDIPYIVHPMETVAIAATMTDDEDVLAAAALHDVMEDCGIGFDELSERFGLRTACLVDCESQLMDGDPVLSWNARKQATIDRLATCGRAEKIIALADKLSNMRAISRDYECEGEAVFNRFHQKDKRAQAWYYRSCLCGLRAELGDTPAWRELKMLIERVFAEAVCAQSVSERQRAAAGD